jgi:hypothetical protein
MGKWVDLGIYEFTENSKASVTLNAQTDEPQGESLIVFDAMRFIPKAQMATLLEGEPFNLEHTWQEVQLQMGNWWEETRTKIEQTVNQWWEDVKDNIKVWWQEQQKKMTDALAEWWQDLQRQIAQWFEQQVYAWLRQCLSSIFLPLGALTSVWIAQRRRKNRSF